MVFVADAAAAVFIVDVVNVDLALPGPGIGKGTLFNVTLGSLLRPTFWILWAITSLQCSQAGQINK